MDRGLCGLPAAEESSTQVIIPGTLTQNHRRGGERSQGGGVPWLLPDPISMMKTKTPREKGTTQVALIGPAGHNATGSPTQSCARPNLTPLYCHTFSS